MNEQDNDLIESNQGDEPLSNHSDNPHFSTILEKRLSRRQVLTGSLSAAVVGILVFPGLHADAQAKKHPSTTGLPVPPKPSLP